MRMKARQQWWNAAGPQGTRQQAGLQAIEELGLEQIVFGGIDRVYIKISPSPSSILFVNCMPKIGRAHV